jgi:hypothetical protein
MYESCLAERGQLQRDMGARKLDVVRSVFNIKFLGKGVGEEEETVSRREKEKEETYKKSLPRTLSR